MISFILCLRCESIAFAVLCIVCRFRNENILTRQDMVVG
jgi:hypothetical protein